MTESTEAEPGGLRSVSAGSPRRTVTGCLVAAVSFLVGVFVAGEQNGVLISTWAYCGDVPPAIATDNWPQGGAYVWFAPFVLRAGVYAVLFALGVRLGGRWSGDRRAVTRGLVCGLVGLASVVLAFVVDFSLFNGMSGDYVPAKCPGGHLPWWPL